MTNFAMGALSAQKMPKQPAVIHGAIFTHAPLKIPNSALDVMVQANSQIAQNNPALDGATNGHPATHGVLAAKMSSARDLLVPAVTTAVQTVGGSCSPQPTSGHASLQAREQGQTEG